MRRSDGFLGGELVLPKVHLDEVVVNSMMAKESMTVVNTTLRVFPSTSTDSEKPSTMPKVPGSGKHGCKDDEFANQQLAFRREDEVCSCYHTYRLSAKTRPSSSLNFRTRRATGKATTTPPLKGVEPAMRLPTTIDSPIGQPTL